MEHALVCASVLVKIHLRRDRYSKECHKSSSFSSGKLDFDIAELNE
jgi:hypothetical protein